MKKALLRAVPVLMLLLLVTLAFASCDALGNGLVLGNDSREDVSVTFDGAGGTALEGVTVKAGQRIPEPETPVRAGYTFVGWHDGVSFWDFENDTVRGGLTLRAVWTPTRYSIAYELGGGENAAANPTVYTVESAPGALGSPARGGYEFAGWYLDASYTEAVTTLPVSSLADLTFFAKWTPITYGITYDLGGGTLPAGAVASYTPDDESFTLPTPKRAGYTFLGWTAEGMDTPSLSVCIEKGTYGEKSYTANWLYNTYTLSFDLAGGTVASDLPDSYSTESPDFTVASPEKRGYRFVGWLLEGESVPTPELVITTGTMGHRSYTAVFEPIRYTITLDLAGGSASVALPEDYTIESGAITLPTLARRGYTFLGWSVNGGDPEMNAVIEAGSIGDVAYTAKFEIITYTITLNLDGGTLLGTLPEGFTVDSPAITLPALAKHGYTFLGWSVDGGEPVMDAVIEAGSIGDVAYTAKFEIITYTVTLDLNGGTLGTTLPEGYTVLDGTITAPAAEKRGYTFLGWRVNGSESLTSTLVIDTLRAEDVTVVAVFRVNVYVITYVGLYDATSQNVLTYTVDSDLITLLDPVRRGYDFVGWTCDGVDTPEKALTIEAGSIGDRSFTAHFEAKKYTLTFNLAGGTIEGILPGEYTIETDGLAIPNPTRDGYEFLGWVLGSGNPIKDLVINAGLVGNKTYTAKWSAIEYKIEYELNGGTFDTDFDDCYDIETDTITLPSPARPGYAFVGWSDGESEPTVGLTIPAGSFGDKSFTANWVIITYTITLPAGVEIPTSYTIESDDIHIPNPTKRGFTFLGWSINGDAELVKDAVIPKGSTGDKLFEAKWEIVDYAITPNLNGGTLLGTLPGSYTVESEDIVLPAAEKSGYTFLGWRVNGTFFAAHTIEAGSVGEVTLVAVFEAIRYPITYSGMEGAVNPNPDSYTVEDGRITLAPPTKRGYTFTGWLIAGEKVMEVTFSAQEMRALTFEATFSLDTYTLTFDTVGGTVTGTLPAEYNVHTESIAIPNAEKAGYTFLGWALLGGEPTKDLVIPQGSVGDRAYVAVYEPIRYTVNYSGVDGAVNPNPDSYTVEDGLITLAPPTKLGYTFTGWLIAGEKVMEVTFSAQEMCALTFEATFSLDIYTLTFDTVGGTITGTLPAEYNVHTESIAIPNPEKAGYTFLGWSISGGEPAKDLVIATGSFGDRAYVAVFEAIEYKIEYELNGGSFSVDFDDCYNVETDTITLPSPEKPGYAFVGWSDGEGDPTVGLTIEAGSIGDKSFTAHWQIITYRVEISLGDGTLDVTVPGSYTVESDDFTLPIPTKRGYTFLGWTYADVTTPVRSVTITKGSITGDLVFTAHWKLTEYKITYVGLGNAANEHNPSFYTMESGTVTVSAPSRYGFTFLGWSLDGSEELSMTVSFDASLMKDIVLTAKWEAYAFSVTYYGTKGAANPNPEMYVTGEAVPLQGLSLPGYTFLGWYDASGNRVEEISAEAGGNLSFTARWQSTVSGTANLNYVLSDDGTYYIIGTYAYTDANIVIPSTYNGKPVKEIAANAFSGNGCRRYIRSVVISDGVEKIGKSAFSGCINMTSLTIGADVKTIGDSAFSGCSALTTLNFNAVECAALSSSAQPFYNCGPNPAGLNVYFSKDVVTVPAYLFYAGTSGSYYPHIGQVVFEEGSVLQSIGSRAFYRVYSMKSINLPESVKTIGWQSFYNCGGLTTIPLYEGLEIIDENAFQSCVGLTTVTIPSTVTKIGSQAFYECTGLTSIYYNAVRAADIGTSSSGVFYKAGQVSGAITLYIGEKVEYIPAYMFSPRQSTSDSPYITSIVFAENSSLTEIGKYAFSYVYKLESLTLPEGVKTIGEYAFQYCYNLTSADLGGTEDIPRFAFAYCTKLAKISFSDSIKSIGQNAFTSCSALTEIHVPSLSAWCGISFYDASANPLTRGAALYVDGERLEELIIPEGTTEIGNYVFYGLKIESLTLPASLESIGEYAFAYCTSLKTVVLPGVTEIGSSAFQGCSALEGVTMPAAETIGNYAFYECKSLTSVLMPAAKTIGSSAFYNCEKLASITFGAALEKIGNDAFYYCTSLESVTLPAGLEEVGSYAFRMCTGLTAVHITDLAAYCEIHFGSSDANPIYYAQKLYVNGALLTELTVPEGVTKIGAYTFSKYALLSSVTIPDSVTSIGSRAFNECTALASVTIGRGVEWMGDYAFYKCAALTAIVLPDSLGNVGYNAFEECTSLASVHFGTGITEIGYRSFYMCTSLASVTLPEGVKKIGQEAFQQCSALRSVNIPKGVTSIGSYAFSYCYALESVYYNAAKLGNFSSSASLFYRAGRNGNGITLTIGKDVTSIPAYLFHTPSNDSDYAKLVAVKLEEGAAFTSIGAYAFYYTKELVEITLPATLTSIGNYAFQQCEALTSVTLPDSVTSIGDYAFSYCYALKSVDLGEGLTTMGKNAFYYCSALEEITIPATCVTVPTKAFSGCTSLKTAILSEGVTAIGQNAFQGCTSLESVILPSTLTSIGSEAFSGCGKLAGITLPGGITSVGDKAFQGCTSLGTFVIPSTVTSIGDYAFKGCTSLTSVTIPDSVKVIGDYAFQGCTGLTAIVIPDSVTTIYTYAFQGCTALTSIVIPDSVTYIGNYAFQGCTALAAVTIGKGVTTLGNYVFADCTALTAVNFNAVSAGNLSGGNNLFAKAGTAGEGIVFTFGKEVTRVPAYLLCPVANIDYASAARISAIVFAEDSVCTTIGDYAFAYTTGFSTITLPESVTSLGQYALAYSRDLVSFTLPAGLTAVPNYLLRGCTALASISLHEDVTAIGAYAFYDCHKLTEITIGKNVKSLGNYAFGNCYGLTRINLEAESFTTYSSSGYYFQNAGRNAAGITLVIGKQVKEIAPYLFYVGSYVENVPKITKIVFAEDGVLSTIGNQCLYNAIYLRTLTIPATVTTIGNYAFQGCIGLIEVENLSSSLTLTEGTEANGHVAYYAKNIYTATEGESKLVTLGGVVYFVDEAKGYYYAIGAEEGATELTFAADLNGHSYEILPGAFRGRTDIRRVTFTEGITSIGTYAFYGCSGIEALALPASIETIGDYTFYGCSSVAEIVIPDSVTAIGKYAFYGCSGAKRLVIGKNAASFGTYAFGEMTALEVLIVNSVKMPASFGSNNYVFYNAARNTEGGMTVTFAAAVKQVPAYMFYPTGSSTYSPVIREVIFLEGSQLTSIGAYAFTYAKLYKITLPESLTAIGNQAFGYCYYLREVVINSKSLTDLTSSAQLFYQAGTSGDGFTVTFGPLVEKVPAYLFYVGNTSNAPKLLSVTFAEGSSCKTIGNYAFYYNTHLTSVTLPSGMTAIGTDAFRECSALREVHVATLTDWLSISFAGQTANPASFGTLYIGGEALPEDLVIPEGVVSIGDYSFVGNKTIKTLTLPASLESIGIYAFANCPQLTELTVNAEVIGHHAFYNLASLKKLTVGKGVKTIALEAFSYCRALEEICFLAESCTLDALSNSYANVFYMAGAGTENGVRVVFGKDVLTVPAYLFAYSSAGYTPRLASVSFEAGSLCTAIGNYAFYNCETLTEVTLPASCKTVGHLAFYGCTGLVSVDLGGCESIGEQAFLGCTSLKDFKADHLTRIDNYAFKGCTALEGFVVGDLVTFLGGGAFQDCTSLRYIALGKGLETIGNNFLSGTTALVEIYYNAADFTVYNYYNTPFYGAGSAAGITLVIGKDVVSVPDYLFYVDSSSYTPATLKTVVFEEGSACKTIGVNAFARVKTLVSVTLPEGLTAIGDGAFYGCTALTDVNLPATLESFGADVFRDCASIAYSVYGGVNYLGNSENPYLIAVSVADEEEIEHLVIHPDARIVLARAFRGYAAIKTVTLGDKLVTIGEYAFYGCSGIEALTVPDSVKTIGVYAFAECSGLKTLRIGKGVTSFGGSAFLGCTALESIYYNAVAVTGTENCNYFSGMANGAALTVGRDVVEIPAYLFQYANVTSLSFEAASSLEAIGDCAFLSTAITEVHLPASLTSIGNSAFRQCKSLVTLTMGDAVTVIGSDAFRDCSALKTLVLSAGLTTVPQGLLRGCSALEDLTLPFLGRALDNAAYEAQYGPQYGHLGFIFGSSSYTDATQVFGYGTSYSSHLYDWYIPASLESVTVLGGVISTRAFENCTMLTELTVGKDVTLIKSGAFSGCSRLDTLTYDARAAETDLAGYPSSVLCFNTLVIGKNVVSLPAYVFYGGGATSVTFHPECALVSVGRYAFASNKMASITLPGTVTALGEGVFQGCTKLEEFTLPEGVTAIPAKAFYQCHSLTAVQGTVTSIGEYAFYDCRALAAFALPATLTEIPSHAFYNTGLTSVVIPAGVARIGNNAFGSCVSLASVTCLGTVELGDAAFSGCSALASFTAAGVSGIGSSAFSGCTSLAELDLGTHTGKIGSSAFSGCSLLTAIALPEGITEIGSSAFSGTGITSITLPNSVTVLGNGAFRDNTVLETVTFGSGITAIPSEACYGATSLKTVVMAEGILNVGPSAFRGCTALTSVTFASSTGIIGNYAFYGCKSLDFEALPASLTEIGSYAFYGCSSITGKLTIPDSVTSIETGAFSGCSSITEVDTGNGARSLMYYTFDSCSSLKVVTIGSSMTYIDRNAFGGGGLTHVYFRNTAANWCYDNPNDYQGAWTIGKSKLTSPTTMASEYFNGKYDLFIE